MITACTPLCVVMWPLFVRVRISVSMTCGPCWKKTQRPAPKHNRHMLSFGAGLCSFFSSRGEFEHWIPFSWYNSLEMQAHREEIKHFTPSYIFNTWPGRQRGNPKFCSEWYFSARLLFCIADISEIESYRSYSPQDDRRGHHSDLSSHSSNERLRDKPRWDVIWF